jgi:hypothetical protein
MRQKFFLTRVVAILALFIFPFSHCHKEDSAPPRREGCMDHSADNFDSQANASCSNCCEFKGSLLFWTDNPSCGALTVKLENGQQSNIVGYYYLAPTNCVNQWGGYFSIKEGTYSYSVTAANPACLIPGGEVTVIGNRCNYQKVY